MNNPAGIAALALVSAILWGVGNYFSGVVSRRIGARRTTLFTQLPNIFVGVIVAALLPGALTLTGASWAVVAAFGGIGGCYFFFEAMRLGRTAVASKVQTGVIALLPLLAGVALGERPGAMQWLGIVIVLASLAVLVFTPNEAVADGTVKDAYKHRASQLALLSGLGFSLGVIALSRTSTADGVWPLPVYRTAIAFGAVVLVLLAKEQLRLERSMWRLVAAAGLLCGIGDATYLWAIQRGELTVVPLITCLHPAVTAVTGWLHARETLHRYQVAAIGLGIVGLGLLAATS